MGTTGLDDFVGSWWPFIISLVIGGITAIRKIAGGTYCHNTVKLCRKTVIITGGASGIGLEVAKNLAQRGAIVIIACRNIEKAVKLEQTLNQRHGKVILMELDISNLQSIRNFVTKIKRDFSKIDILINNAAIIFHSHEITSEKLELTFVTNYLGPFLLTHLLMPLLAEAKPGRIINVCAGAHKVAKLSLDNLNFRKEFVHTAVFGQTKLALMLFTKYMSGLILAKNDTVTINAVNPGLVRGTNHLKNSPLGGSWFNRLTMFPWIWLFLKSPHQGAQSIIHVATDSAYETYSGEYVSECANDSPSDLVNNTAFMKELYEKSLALCGAISYED